MDSGPKGLARAWDTPNSLAETTKLNTIMNIVEDGPRRGAIWEIPAKPMTMHERMLAVVQGREADRVPFVQYNGMVAPNEEIWKLIGRENMGLVQWSAVHKWDTPNCRWESEPFERNGRSAVRTTLYTPEGSLTEEKVFEPVYNSGQPAKHFIKEPADYRVLLAFLRDCGIVADGDRYLRDKAAVGDDGLVMVAVDRTPFQQLWVDAVNLHDQLLNARLRERRILVGFRRHRSGIELGTSSCQQDFSTTQ